MTTEDVKALQQVLIDLVDNAIPIKKDRWEVTGYGINRINAALALIARDQAGQSQEPEQAAGEDAPSRA